MPNKKKQRANAKKKNKGGGSGKNNGSNTSGQREGETNGHVLSTYVHLSSLGATGGGACEEVLEPMRVGSIQEVALRGLPANFYTEPPINRPAPDMRIHGNPAEVQLAVMTASRNAELVRDSRTLRRLIEAYALLDAIDEKWMEYLEMLKPLESNMDLLSANDEYLTICVDLLRSIVILTDRRLGMTTRILRALPFPDCCLHITETNYPADVEHNVQLHNVGARQFVVLLVGALYSGFLPGLKRSCLHLLHELRLHATGNYSWLDWNDLRHVKGSDGVPFSEAEARFALATLGLKECRGIYRNGLDEESSMPPQMRQRKQQPTHEEMLASIEVFANDQIEFRPTSGVGYFNKGWVLTQAPAVRGTNAVEAAADCFDVMTKAYEVADLDQDDFVRAAARIEAAGSLLFGGGGVVGLANKYSTVVRDMRSRQVKLADGTIEVETLPDGTTREQRRFHKRCRMNGVTPEANELIFKNENDRIANGIPDTFLFKDEKLLVEHWEVKRLWNQAIEPIDNLAKFKHSHFVYGESMNWDNIVRVLNKEYAKLGHNQFANAPSPPGFILQTDGGMNLFGPGSPTGVLKDTSMVTTCTWCGKNGIELLRCTKCKKAAYCDANCQKGHWKLGGHKLECKVI